MKAIFSSTYDPQYMFFIPIAAYSWKKLGVDSICFMPYIGIDVSEHKRLQLILINSPDTAFHYFKAPKNKQATYAQLSRLFACALPMPKPTTEYAEERLITTDVDMAVFSKTLVTEDDGIHVWGKDLVPEGQMAMCYVSMPAYRWEQVMHTQLKSPQQMLDQHLGHIECDHFRGNYWGYDQEQLYKHVCDTNYIEHFRAIPGTQFANNRADRDDAFWFNKMGPDLFDAHLWRPGYEEKNFEKIIRLFSTMFPGDDLTWLRTYRDKFIELL